MRLMQNILCSITAIILILAVLMPLAVYAAVNVSLSWDAPTAREDGTDYTPQIGANFEIYETVAGVRGPADVVPHTQLTQSYVRPNGYNGAFENTNG